MVAAASALEAAGFEVVRFNFPYREQGSKRPDPMPVLKDSIAAQAKRLAHRGPLVLGGRSMGGRAASMLVAEGFACAGLLLLAYPLHPAGQKEKLRAAHLSQIRVPVLCFNGTRDALCDQDLMRQALASAGPNWRMHWLEGADHSFRVPKSSGTDVYREVCEVSREWLSRLA
jgi:predicted alpha/beta-hydrolase family hydrolase